MKTSRVGLYSWKWLVSVAEPFFRNWRWKKELQVHKHISVFNLCACKHSGALTFQACIFCRAPFLPVARTSSEVKLDIRSTWSCRKEACFRRFQARDLKRKSMLFFFSSSSLFKSGRAQAGKHLPLSLNVLFVFLEGGQQNSGTHSYRVSPACVSHESSYPDLPAWVSTATCQLRNLRISYP